MEELNNQKQQIESRIAELEEQQKGQIKQWKRDKNAAELIALRSELAEVDTKIENNPKHAQLAAEFRWGKDLGGSDETMAARTRPSSRRCTINRFLSRTIPSRPRPFT
ncbi:MAG: hypothetical protein ACYTGS_02025 [Planctomycetota bacterium]